MGLQRMPAHSLCPSGQKGVRRPAAAIRFAAAVTRGMVSAADTLLLWMERYRQRRALVMLSDHMLKDLGLSRSDAGRESGKRFWEG